MVSKKIEVKKFSIFLVILHLIGFINYIYAFYYDMAHVKFPANFFPDKHTDFGGKFKYLTVLNLVIFVFFA